MYTTLPNSERCLPEKYQIMYKEYSYLITKTKKIIMHPDLSGDFKIKWKNFN